MYVIVKGQVYVFTMTLRSPLTRSEVRIIISL